MPNKVLSVEDMEYLIHSAADLIRDFRDPQIANNPVNRKNVLNRPCVAEIIAVSDRLKASRPQRASDL